MTDMASLERSTMFAAEKPTGDITMRQVKVGAWVVVQRSLSFRQCSQRAVGAVLATLSLNNLTTLQMLSYPEMATYEAYMQSLTALFRNLDTLVKVHSEVTA